MGGQSYENVMDTSEEDAIREKEKARADRQDRRKEKRQKEKDKARRSEAKAYGVQEVNDYFSEMGIDPSGYKDSIKEEVKKILDSVPRGTKKLNPYFDTAGEDILADLENKYRTSSERGLDRVIQPEFDRTRIPDTIDDPYLAEILDAQRAEAEKYIDNLLAREVITQGGYNAAQGQLDRQADSIRANLTEIGDQELATGRQALRDVADRARHTASTLRLGQNFDPMNYTKELDSAFTGFLDNLQSNIKAKVGSKNLFDTSGLPVVAGAAQGAGNTKYNRNALAGLIEPDDTTDEPDRTTSSTGLF